MFRPFRVLRFVPLAAASLAAGSCGGAATTPTPSGGNGGSLTAVSITCPADINVIAPGDTVAVTYTTTASGGVAPLTTTCSTASGSSFAAGTTTVTCTARDAIGQSGICAFAVNVTPGYKLKGTSFLAFGDSITRGENGEAGQDIACSSVSGLFQSRPSFVDCPNSFPNQLKLLMAARYKLQTVAMSQVGEPGKTAAEGAADLPPILASTHPQALLLLWGANDVQMGNTPADVVDGLMRQVQSARGAGVDAIFLSTLLPQTRSFSSRDRALEVSAEIRRTAWPAGVILVDTEAAMTGQASLYIASDGLHPTIDGNKKIAETFFASIKANFELPPGPAAAALR